MIRRIFISSLLVLALAGCIENRASFFILDMKVPTEECVTPADINATHYSWGVWDIGLTGGYFVHPAVINNMASSTRLSPLTSESNIIQVDGAWVAVMDSNDNMLRDETFVSAPVSVWPEGSSTGMNFPVITDDIYDDLAGVDSYTTLCFSIPPVTSNIVVRIQIVGITAGGQDMETPYFYFPISVCCGCNVYFPSDAWDAALTPPTYNCHESEAPTTETLCYVGQDWDVDCRLCAGNYPALCDPSQDGFSNPWLP